MTTIKISVKSAKDANLLIRLLKSMNFVSRIEQINEDKLKEGENQFQKINTLLATVKRNELFDEISDPIQWQKSLRNEWN